MSPVDSNQNVLCNINQELGEFGVYNLRVSNTSCQLDVLKEPVNIYFRKYL